MQVPDVIVIVYVNSLRLLAAAVHVEQHVGKGRAKVLVVKFKSSHTCIRNNSLGVISLQPHMRQALLRRAAAAALTPSLMLSGTTWRRVVCTIIACVGNRSGLHSANSSEFVSICRRSAVRPSTAVRAKR